MNKYQENGYRDRKDYLKSLAELYDVSYENVYAIAEMYGEEEDFDGLINALEDAYLYNQNVSAITNTKKYLLSRLHFYLSRKATI